MFKRIDHIEIVPRDYRRAVDFYTSVLGFKEKAHEHVGRPPLEEIVYLELNDTVIELMNVSEPGPAPSGPWHAGYRMLALEVDDMDETVAYLKTKGVELARGPVTMGKPSERRYSTPTAYRSNSASGRGCRSGPASARSYALGRHSRAVPPGPAVTRAVHRGKARC